MPIPGVAAELWTNPGNSGSGLGVLRDFAGGAATLDTLFALGVLPQLVAATLGFALAKLAPAIPRADDRERLRRGSRFAAPMIALVLAIGFYASSIATSGRELTTERVLATGAVLVPSLVAGSMLVTRIVERVRASGIEHGLVWIAIAGATSRLVLALPLVAGSEDALQTSMFLASTWLFGVATVLVLTRATARAAQHA